MDKKVIAKFPTGEVFEIDAHYIACCIAHKVLPGDSNIDEVTEKVNEILDDEFIIFEHIWDIPWAEAQICATQVSISDFEAMWNRGSALVSVNW